MDSSGSCAERLLLPEEEVRQALLHYLVDELRVPSRLIAVEYALTRVKKGDRRRLDLVVWRPGGNGLHPWLMAECKRPGLPLTEKVAFQTARYLAVLRPDFVLITNGGTSFCFERTGFETTGVTPVFQPRAGLPFFPGGETGPRGGPGLPRRGGDGEGGGQRGGTGSA